MLTPAKDLVKKAKYRPAEAKDLDWINEHCGRVQATPLDIQNTQIWIAESMGRPIAFGGKGQFFVLEAFRNLGVATELKKRLVAD